MSLFIQRNFHPPAYADVKHSSQVKADRLNSYIMTLLINKILFSNSIEYAKYTFLYKYKVFFVATRYFQLCDQKKIEKTINKVETVSVLNCMLIQFHRIYEKHANIIN